MEIDTFGIDLAKTVFHVVGPERGWLAGLKPVIVAVTFSVRWRYTHVSSNRLQ
jgi:hypothetical protein